MSSLLYSPQFKTPEAELRKKHIQFLDSSHGFQQQQSRQQQQQQSSSLMRYRSAPSSVLLDLVDNNGAAAGCEDFRDFRYPRPSSPEVENVLARFISSCNAPDSDNGSNNQTRSPGQLLTRENLLSYRPIFLISILRLIFS